MAGETYEFASVLWRDDKQVGDRYFVTVSDQVSRAIARVRGEGSYAPVKVRVLLGRSIWETSMLPHGDGRYRMPLKKSVLEAESLVEGAMVVVQLILL